MFYPILAILFGTIVLSIKTRFIQIRAIPRMITLLFAREKVSKGEHTVSSRKALFTAMATTIGMGNIVSPIIAIGFAGPGALVGFALSTVFGGAATFAEVIYSVNYRKRNDDGTVAGGPMQYLKVVLHPAFSFIYASLGMVLLASWSGAQANQVASLLIPFSVPRYYVAFGLAGVIIFFLVGGIKRIGSLAEKMVPVMFVLYCSALGWIVFKNLDKLPHVMQLIYDSFFDVGTGAGVLIGIGMQRSLRWGIGRGMQANEAGVGTASIAHAMADTKSPYDQAILALVAVYTNGILCLLSGLAVLLTGVWQDTSLTFDISMMNSALNMYFPGIGTIILIVSAVLFSFSTLLGNSYYGTQCYLYATNNRYISVYRAIIALCIIWGSMTDVRTVWSIIDFFMIPVAIVNMIGIVVLAFRKGHLLKVGEAKTS